MKKFISILLCVCMVLTMGLAVAADGVSGDFTGTAQGLGGDVTVTLTLKDGKIVGCTATGDKETEGIGSKVIDSFHRCRIRLHRCGCHFRRNRYLRCLRGSC